MAKLIIFIKSYWLLCYFFVLLRQQGLEKVLAKIDITKNKQAKPPTVKETTIINGFQSACSFHFLNVECLERSLALYKLLRTNNYESRLCIGVKRKPFLSHAWVETNIKELDESSHRDTFYVFISMPKEGDNSV